MAQEGEMLQLIQPQHLHLRTPLHHLKQCQKEGNTLAIHLEVRRSAQVEGAD